METPETTSMSSGITEDSNLPLALRLGLGAIGGLIGAVLGAVFWGLVVFFLQIEISYLAIAVGFLAGGGVLVGSLGSRGILFQVMAVDFSLFGLALGYYISFYAFARDNVFQNYGAEYAEGVSIFSPITFSLFLENLGNFIDGFTIVIVVAAVITAWLIPRKQK